MSDADPINLSEFEPLAREVLPREHYDFIAGGVDDELTVAENVAAYRRIQLLPRVLVDVSSVDPSTTVLGQRIGFPVLLAPVGAQRFAHVDGELASARAAAAAATIFPLSTTATHSMEDVAAASDGPKWFQLYMMGGRTIAEQFVRRAEAAGYSTICLTVDSPRHGNRERDTRNGPAFMAHAMPVNFAEVGYHHASHNPAVTWDDVDWLHSLTSKPVVLKGIVRADDACRAVEHGVSAIVVSNHGGRQLDTVPATIDVLPEIVEAVAGRAEVLIDGGIRRGTDVFKALALGATAVMIGRPFIWGLAVGGEAGVGRVLQLLRAEFELTMAMVGCRSVAEIDADLLRRPRR
jgi:isopentenyl diphosphate isomerase/L-lactate dehydrogenase-like FMN-dependent dehydrogenase